MKRPLNAPYLNGLSFNAFGFNTPRLKTSLITALVGCLLLTGCQKAETPADKTVAPTSATTSSSATNSTVIATASAVSATLASTVGITTVTDANALNNGVHANPIDPKIFVGHETAGALAVAMSSFLVNNLTESSDLTKISPEKKSCLLNSTHDTVVPQIEKFLTKKLSADGLKKTNTFYASELGQKLTLTADQKIKQQMGAIIPNPVTLTDEEKAKLKSFSNTPEGKKLTALFAPANHLEMQQEIIEPMMKSEFEKCEVKVTGVN